MASLEEKRVEIDDLKEQVIILTEEVHDAMLKKDFILSYLEK